MTALATFAAPARPEPSLEERLAQAAATIAALRGQVADRDRQVSALRAELRRTHDELRHTREVQ